MSRKTRTKRVNINAIDTPRFSESEMESIIHQMRDNEIKLQKLKNDWGRLKKSFGRS